MAITSEIRLPAEFGFRLRNVLSGKTTSAPEARMGYDWRVWSAVPAGIEYSVEGPGEKIIRWDPETWEPTFDWNETAWPIRSIV